jgi:hypothetical protein
LACDIGGASIGNELREDVLGPSDHGIEAVIHDDGVARGLTHAGIVRKAAPQPVPSGAQ